MRSDKGKKHNYPKTRKPRKSPNGKTQLIYKKIGKDKLFEIWKTGGHNIAAIWATEILGIYISRMVVQYIAQSNGWVRIISDFNDHAYKTILSGKISPSTYKTIKFEGLAI